MIVNLQYFQVKCARENKVIKLRANQETRDVISRKLSIESTRASRSGKYLHTDIFLDTRSTYYMLKNPDMLINVVKGKTVMRAVTNGGHQDSIYTGIFTFFQYG